MCVIVCDSAWSLGLRRQSALLPSKFRELITLALPLKGLAALFEWRAGTPTEPTEQATWRLSICAAQRKRCCSSWLLLCYCYSSSSQRSLSLSH